MRHLRTIIIVLFGIAIPAFLFIYLTSGMRAMDNFKIKNIVVKEGKALDFSYLKGRNIFTLNLEQESRRILQAYPYYKKVRLVRVMPNMLFVDCARRSPLACVDAGRRLYVDENNVVYSLPAQNPVPQVPVIVGLERKIGMPRNSRNNGTQDLSYVLSIIQEAKVALNAQTIQRIDMSQKGQASLFIPFKNADILRETQRKNLRAVPEGLEVKIGFDDIKSKIKILSELLKQASDELYNIQYIDLRFKEPVIKPRQKN